MSGRALWQAVNLDQKLTAPERATLAALAFYCRGEDDFCSPGKDTLKKKTGLTTHYLGQAIGMLEREGLISIEKRKSVDEPWRNASNVYTLLFLEDWGKSLKKDETNYDIYDL